MARMSDDTGDTALHRAAEIGDLEMMEELIAAGAAVDAARADGHRPVHCALHRGRKPRDRALDAARFQSLSKQLQKKGTPESQPPSLKGGGRDLGSGDRLKCLLHGLKHLHRARQSVAG